jgi:outer membrane protein assembly factor BamB
VDDTVFLVEALEYHHPCIASRPLLIQDSSMNLRRLVFALLIAVLPSSVLGGDWTEFRGPSRQGLSDAVGLPLTWSESQNVAWKVPVPGTAWSSPVVQDGLIYLTTAVGIGEGERPPQSLRVLCLEAASGRTVWDVEAFRQPGGERIEIHQKNSHASPTPIVEEDRLYVHFGPHGTACLNTADGAILWETRELEYKPTHGTGGSPALAGDLLIICCDGHDVQYVAGLDKENGEVRWKTPRDTSPAKGFSFCTPIVIEAAGRSQAVCPGSDAVFAYDPATGEEIWRVRYEGGYSVVPRPVAGNGLVYVCSGFGDGRLMAVDPAGTGDITDSHVRWTLKRGVPKSPSVLLVEQTIFMVDDQGIATCVDALTGEVHWTQRLGGKFSASPIHAQGRIYCQDEAGTTVVFRAAREYEELARNVLADGERTFASFAVVDDALLLRSEKHLYRIENEHAPAGGR